MVCKKVVSKFILTPLFVVGTFHVIASCHLHSCCHYLFCFVFFSCQCHRVMLVMLYPYYSCLQRQSLRDGSSNFFDILKVSTYTTTPTYHTQTITIALKNMAETSRTIQWHFPYRIKNCWEISFSQGITALPYKLEPHTKELPIFQNSNFANYLREELLHIKK